MQDDRSKYDRSNYDRNRYRHRASSDDGLTDERREAQARSRARAVQQANSQRSRQSQRQSQRHSSSGKRESVYSTHSSSGHSRSSRSAGQQAGSHRTSNAHRASSQDRRHIQQAQHAVRPAYASSYSLSHDKVEKARDQRKRRALLGGIVAAIIAVIAIVVIFFPPFYSVKVNGQDRTVQTGTTIQTLIDNDFASPKPGNLLAVDGEVLKEGGGYLFSATVNGSQTNDPKAAVPRGAVIEISDGADKDEPYTEKVETIAHATSKTTATQDSYYFGSIHLYSDGEDGEQSVRKGETSGKTATVVTKKAIDSGFSAFTVDTGGDKVIALTFDDGPWPSSTREILNILKENNAHATFFMIGNQVSEHADDVKALLAAGNQLATHTYDHADGSGQGVNLTYMSKDEQIAEVTKGYKAIEDVIGTSVSHVLRAPGGNYYGELVETLHPYVDVEVGWDVDTEDWRRPGSDKIAERIKSAKPGQVILCHDGGGDRSQTVAAVREAVPAMIAQGYKFVTVDELLAYNNSKK